MYPRAGKMTTEDKQYMAEDDCRTLISVKEIMADKARYKRALAYAKKKRATLTEVMGENT